jgi:aerobic carbon-monoxide dehydrogenase medium subunit
LYIPEFNYHRPGSFDDACKILAESPDAVPLAGGTDLLVEMKQAGRNHKDLVSLRSIDALHSIELGSGGLSIGACATHNQIISSAEIQRASPAIAVAASCIGTDQVRNTATIGGNLCTGASCSDLAPILIALDAEVEFRGLDSKRNAPLEEFFVSHRETRIKKGELMSCIIVRSNGATTLAWYEKFGLREAASISVASAAVALTVENGICKQARIVIGAVAPTPKLSTKASEVLRDQPISDMIEDSELLRLTGEAAATDSLPIDDIRGSADYRRTIIKVITKRAVINALKPA